MMMTESGTSEAIEASVVILAKNEAKHIQRAVRSAQGFREVVVVDSRSDDGTAQLAAEAGARVVQFEWNGNYPKKKEWSLGEVTYDWVIYLDADEFFNPALLEEIRGVIADQSISAFEVPLSYFWMGSRLKHGHRVRKRIGMRRSRAFWPRPNDLHVTNMWEVEGHYQPRVTRGRTAQLLTPLGHSDEDGLYEYFARHNRYSDWEAHMLVERDQASLQNRSTLGKLAARMPAKYILFFLYSYIFKRGYLDGRAGYHYALALSFYYWQVQIKSNQLTVLGSFKPSEIDFPGGGRSRDGLPDE